MTAPRRAQVDLERTPCYHLVSRCVRRAFLCGQDRDSGRNFDHRKHWLVERIRWLGDIFAVDVCAYAVMSNHFHLVVRVDLERARGWSERMVLARYGKLFPASVRALPQLPVALQASRLALFRQRLADVSWLMRALNEWIARRANREDGCTGRFWEGRFKSQALLDERALLTCMSYVDLNPVRAGLAASLDDADFTSIQERLRAVARGAASPLARFADQARAQSLLPMRFRDYVQLLEWSGRLLVAGKRGALTGPPPTALAHLTSRPDEWLATMRSLPAAFGHSSAIGTPASLAVHAAVRGARRVRGLASALRLYGSSTSV